jgi:peptidoglycan/LPS O-acetylase OafA/YrhL
LVRVILKRPIGIQLLAALLTIYTMGGFLLAVRMVTEQDQRYRWWIIVVAAVAFAIATGIATLAVWRVERRAPWLLVACGALGGALCLALPAAIPAESLAPGMWRAAIQGAVLILAFLLLAAWYMRSVVRARTTRS